MSRGAVQRPNAASQEEVTVLDADYADEIASMDGTKESNDRLCRYAAQAGIRIYARKTVVMAVAKNTSQRPYTEEGTVNISVEGSLVQQVIHLTYLGVSVTISSGGSTASMDRELSVRLSMISKSKWKKLSRLRVPC